MLLLHRLTPFAITALLAVGLVGTSLRPFAALTLLPICLVLTILLFARLVHWRFSHRESWGLISLPLLLIISATLLFLLTDDAAIRYLTAVMTTIVAFFYAEHLFTFVHLPSAYQAYGLQNVGGMMTVLSTFFLSTGGYSLYTYARLPLPVFAAVFAILMFGQTYAALWIAKTPRDRAMLYALAAAVIFTELLVAFVYLPTVAITSGALLAVLNYMYLGLSRAQMQAKLSRLVVRRYLVIGVLMVVAVLITAKWI